MASSTEGPAPVARPADLAERVLTDPAIAELAQRTTFDRIDGGHPLRCGCSGGPDSSALAVLAVASGHRPVLVYVDHGLRPSGHEAEWAAVATLADRLACPAERVAAHVADGPNLEDRARRARWAALGPDAVVGHTADDQAESVLLALLRGAGLDGLSGMTADRHPILGIRRHETRSLCRSLGIEATVDPTNADRRFVRNRIRHELLPLASDIAGRDVAAVVAAQAAVLADEAAALDALAAQIDVTDAPALAAAPVALARRAVRRWLRAADADGQPPDRDAVERVLAVAAGRSRSAQIRGRLTVRRSEQRLRLESTELGRGGERAPSGDDG